MEPLASLGVRTFRRSAAHLVPIAAFGWLGGLLVAAGMIVSTDTAWTGALATALLIKGDPGVS